MNKIIGLYKELDDDEKISFEDRTILPTVFIKEAETKNSSGVKQKKFLSPTQ